ncbi:YpdA family putative bacillithiol disulfide reductase [Paenibacillus sp. CAA11]|uniref:YpdA family putative bacillithiol disulfide reductase n=1 Tax=Paenibacillus sp. CAA11 TaxID=1532905 RepID=UPI000D334779|nr:YpdA family putative bacillithiol disulfide reductase [Paenibacillus sp. CAA11]AWB44405.1 YpdA family putative bacillithiol disulfide reductase [Paenibacillus sp. CAA11]
MEDVIIIGAGPCGLSAAIECKQRGLSTLILEKHNIVHSIYLYPVNMQFFSTAELLEIGGIPFATPNDKPFRHEAMVYYRKVAEHYKLRIAAYEEAEQITKQPDGTFIIRTNRRSGGPREHHARHVVISSGYFDHPNMIGIPGEDSDKVTHYFREAHPYAGMKVAVIGGSNSAVDAALELRRVGAEVTVIYRGEDLSGNIKPWVRPIFDSAVSKGDIQVRTRSAVIRIEDDFVVVQSMEDGSQEQLANDFVLAMTGFRPDRGLLGASGIQMSADLDKPVFDPATMESNVEGLYVAGVVASGRNANEVFIETGRGHGSLIANHIAGKLAEQKSPASRL